MKRKTPANAQNEAVRAKSSLHPLIHLEKFYTGKSTSSFTSYEI